MKKEAQKLETSTEEKIKKAARSIFYRKGYAATRTRDIAEEAQINLALLNYYFRSKEKLFQLIMTETLLGFYQHMGGVFNDENTSLEKKTQLFAEKYIDLLITEPEMPMFIMSEIRNHGAQILDKLPTANSILQSVFITQFEAAVRQGKILEPNPLHFLMNLTGLVVFPFMNAPVLKKVGQLSDDQFDALMRERKKRIPIWMDAIFKTM